MQTAKLRAKDVSQHVHEEVARFERGVKRWWPSEAEPVQTWVESSGTRTLERDRWPILEVFARHGPPTTETHSAAATARERTAAGRAQVTRTGQERVGAAGKRPAKVQGAGGKTQRRRGMGGGDNDCVGGRGETVCEAAEANQGKSTQGEPARVAVEGRTRHARDNDDTHSTAGGQTSGEAGSSGVDGGEVRQRASKRKHGAAMGEQAVCRFAAFAARRAVCDVVCMCSGMRCVRERQRMGSRRKMDGNSDGGVSDRGNDVRSTSGVGGSDERPTSTR